jgi:hypothetical protein
MNHDEKFWLSLWLGLGALLLIVTAIGTYAGYLNDQRDQAYVNKGLQPYTVERCVDISTTTEWHEAGWTQPIQANSVTILH